MDPVLLDRLRQSGSPVSGEQMASELGISRVALWKRVETLKTWGYEISAARKGYSMTRDDGLAAADFRRAEPVRLFPQTSSTMDEARTAAVGGAPSGTLVAALSQTKGRGRQGRTWESPPGSLYVSFVLRSSLPLPCAGALALETAAILLDYLEAKGVRGAEFRWPNDFMAAGRKLGGILLETSGAPDRLDFYIVGLGLNFHPAPVESRAAASLRDLSVSTPRRRDVAQAVCDRLVAWAASPVLEARRWDRLVGPRPRSARASLWNGRIVRVTPSGFTSRGELLGAEDGKPLAAGECVKMHYQGESL